MLKTLCLIAVWLFVVWLRDWSNRKMFGDIETKRQRGKDGFRFE